MDFFVQVVRNINIALSNKQVFWFLRYVSKYETLSKSHIHVHVVHITQKPQDLQNCECNI